MANERLHHGPFPKADFLADLKERNEADENRLRVFNGGCGIP
jgi:hypothetical protein